MEELSRAKGHIVHIMTVKLSNWTELPWFPCILAHPDVSVAMPGAVKIMQVLDRHLHPDAHHRLSLEFCVGAARSELEQFAGGRPMRSLSLLLHHVLKLNFIPIAEREVEGPHS